MAIIQSGASPDLWTINPISNAGRVTLYDSLGNELTGIGTIKNINNVLDALNEEVVLTLSGQANTSIQLWGSTGTFTVSFQANIDGINWFSVLGKPLAPGVEVSSATGDGVWFIDTSGYKQVRARVTSYTSGSTICSMIADPEQRVDIGGNTIVLGTGSDNTTNSTSKVPVLAARANTSAPSWTDGYMVPLSVDTSGALRITGTISAANASISTTGSSPPASATYIGGSVTTAAPSYTNGTMNALSLTTTGLLRVDGSGVTQPVSGTVTANAGTGNFNVVGTGTAGSPASGVITVQGISGGTAIPVSISGGAVNSDGYVTTAAPSYTNNTFQPLSLTTVGALRIDGSAVTQPISAASLPLPTGAATETTLAGVLTTTAFQARINTLGQKTMANSTPVVLASDQAAIPVVVDKSTTGTITSVVGSTSNTSLLASNSNRISATIYNDSNKTMYVALGATASTSSYSFQLAKDSYWELSTTYTGAISAVWASGVSGNALVTELT
jgi:hypothetical protein